RLPPPRASQRRRRCTGGAVRFSCPALAGPTREALPGSRGPPAGRARGRGGGQGQQRPLGVRRAARGGGEEEEEEQNEEGGEEGEEGRAKGEEGHQEGEDEPRPRVAGAQLLRRQPQRRGARPQLALGQPPSAAPVGQPLGAALGARRRAALPGGRPAALGRIEVGIWNDGEFGVGRRVIRIARAIWEDARFQENGGKTQVRGKGIGGKFEADEPLSLCIWCHDEALFDKAVGVAQAELRKVRRDYRTHCAYAYAGQMVPGAEPALGAPAAGRGAGGSGSSGAAAQEALRSGVEARPAPAPSVHAQMQKAHDDVQQWEHKAEMDLQRLARAKEQALEFEKALRESWDHLHAADDVFKFPIAKLKSDQEAESKPAPLPASKLGDLLAGKVDMASVIGCDDLLEDLVSAEVELEGRALLWVLGALGVLGGAGLCRFSRGGVGAGRNPCFSREGLMGSR
ncbi:unnamed protein product, partial [Prorocentrum cordatum]